MDNLDNTLELLDEYYTPYNVDFSELKNLEIKTDKNIILSTSENILIKADKHIFIESGRNMVPNKPYRYSIFENSSRDGFDPIVKKNWVAYKDQPRTQWLKFKYNKRCSCHG